MVILRCTNREFPRFLTRHTGILITANLLALKQIYASLGIYASFKIALMTYMLKCVSVILSWALYYAIIMQYPKDFEMVYLFELLVMNLNLFNDNEGRIFFLASLLFDQKYCGMNIRLVKRRVASENHVISKTLHNKVAQ